MTLNLNPHETAAVWRQIEGDNVRLVDLVREDSQGNPDPDGFVILTVDYGYETERMAIGTSGSVTIWAWMDSPATSRPSLADPKYDITSSGNENNT